MKIRNPTRTAALHAAFALFDVDGDEVISLRDLSATLARRGHSCSDTEVAQMMGRVGDKGEGGISREAFVAHFEPCMGVHVNMSAQVPRPPPSHPGRSWATCLIGGACGVPRRAFVVGAVLGPCLG